MSEGERKPFLTIPTEAESSAAFKIRLAELIKDPQTHIYLDTSFLMWMTKIGSVSRQELLGWFSSNCAGRVHVPVWAGHEYLKHHVAGTIVDELSRGASELRAVSGSTYAFFRPFFDEPLGVGGKDPAALRATTRDTLTTLGQIANTAHQWRKTYSKHANEVISFINASVPENTSIYEHIPNISAQGADRYAGSVPPGYQDRHKKGKSSETAMGGEVAPPDSNRFGDLLFWRESLDHAKEVEATAIIFVTNDRKNDWHMGGMETMDIDSTMLALRKNWKPVPRAHPMLVAEAKSVANVEQVELLDSPYLAAILRDVAIEFISSFADVAIVSDDPLEFTESVRKAKLLDERQTADALQLSLDAEENGHIFSDASGISVSKAALLRALLESRSGADNRIVELLNEWRATIESQTPLRETFSQETFDGLDHKELVKLARELHDRVISGNPGHENILVDLVSIIDEFPPKTATCFFLGFLASMYLIRETNGSRIPPQSPVANLLFSKQSADHAIKPVAIVAKRLGDNLFRPLYLPSSDPKTIDAELDIEQNSDGIDELRSLRIDGVELLTAAQSDQALNISSLFGQANPVDGNDILRKACELFVVPFDQVERIDSFALNYTLTATIGFKRPSDVSIPKEQPIGKR